MPKFTPAPWGRNIKPVSKYPVIYAGKAPRHVYVASIARESGISEDEAEANADLIVAAPHLFAWLEKAVQMAKQQAAGGDDAPSSGAWAWLADMGQMTLDKAEGKTP